MFYRTLHAYVFRELLRIFLLTASALTTLLAFGGTFKALTKQSIDVVQLMTIMLDLMPAMLAYAIPIAALFAAVLVYWRMSTDNEMTACRAGGISFVTIVMPAFILGLAVASVDLGFVNFVVPLFLQKAERAIMRDMGSLIVSQINQQEHFAYGDWDVYADEAKLVPSGDPDLSIVQLTGAAVTKFEGGKAVGEAIAKSATIRIRNIPKEDASQMGIYVDTVSIFNPRNAFQLVQGGGDSSQFLDRDFDLPSLLKSKAKFLNLNQLKNYSNDPWTFPSVNEDIKKLAALRQYDVVSHNVMDAWNDLHKAGKPLEFQQSTLGSSAPQLIQIFAAAAEIRPDAPIDRSLLFTGSPGKPVRVETSAGGVPQSTYTCESVEVQLALDEIAGQDLHLVLLLQKDVKRTDHVLKIEPTSPGDIPLSGIVLPSALGTVSAPAPQDLVDNALVSAVPAVKALGIDALSRRDKLWQSIDSELHSRGSFALSCLTLVLFGAALGILLRGRNPLAVFVLGFVPAVFLVLLITAGRELAEGSAKNVNTGLILIWAGNGLLLALVAGAYAKLLRH